MIKITDLCTGCRACEQVCPKSCITMIPDKEGFIIPIINQEKCVNCGLCQRTCPQNRVSVKPKLQEVWGLTAKDRDTLFNSSSGAVFAVLAYAVIDAGGWVAGCIFNDNIVAQHIVSNKREDILRMQSSKYVQSDTKETYSKIKNLLTDGRFVLFSGTGCQVAGLKSYLKKDYPNLLTLDLICHGVPSPLLFEKYKQWWSERKQGTVQEVNFRDKVRQGWGLGYKVKVKVKDKDNYSFAYLDPYYYHFLEGNVYRKCCYECKYNENNRFSDITIGDFWGLLDCHPEFYDLEGVSVAIVNTQRGADFLSKELHQFKSIFSTFKNVSKKNGNLIRPTKCSHEIRDQIYQGIYNLSAVEYFKKNFPIPFSTKFKFWIKSQFPGSFKLWVKKFIMYYKNHYDDGNEDRS